VTAASRLAVERAQVNVPSGAAGQHECAAATSSRLAYGQRPAHHVRQLRDVGGDEPGDGTARPAL
jgi:hypothetical protein